MRMKLSGGSGAAAAAVSSEASRPGRQTNKQQLEKRKVDLRPSSGRLFRMVFVTNAIMLVTIIVAILSALISPSASQARLSPRLAGNGDNAPHDTAAGDAAAALMATVGADNTSSFTSAGSSSKQVSPATTTTGRLAGGNGQSIRDRKRKILTEESGQPLRVPSVHATSDNNQHQRQEILKKFGSQNLANPFEQVDSADLPAEFRDIDASDLDQKETAAPKEQSRLARLCEQTSSVLASVLPAPFGGHKRSILCQFFGQVPLAASSSAGANKNNPPRAAIASGKEATPLDSVAVIHPLDQTVQQQPIMLMHPVKHPIELLLEHQRQQMQAARVPQRPPQLVQDLKGAASVLDYSYHQRLEAPLAMQQQQQQQQPQPQQKHKELNNNGKLKQRKTSEAEGTTSRERFSEPLKVSSSPMLSTSGWRIFEKLPEQSRRPDQTLANSTTSAPTAQSPSTTSLPPLSSAVVARSLNRTDADSASRKPTKLSKPTVDTATTTTTTKTTTTTTTSAPPQASTTISIQQKLNLSSDKLGAAQLLVLGRPPNYAADPASDQRRPTKESTVGTRRSEVAKLTSTKKPNEARPEPVRTIEVIAQSNNSTSPPPPDSAGAKQTAATEQTSNQERSNNNREELVIASINNLTRIAFGNQLRDTFKVINKLIDQQAGLFAAASVSKPSAGDSDAMLTSESRKVTKKMPPPASSEASAELKKKTKLREKDPLSNFFKTSTLIPKTSKRVAPASASVSSDESESAQQRRQQPVRTTAAPTTKSNKLAAARSASTRTEQQSKSSPGKSKSNSSNGETTLKQMERKSTVSSLESRRLTSLGVAHTVSRSLSLDSRRKTTPFKPLAPFETSWPLATTTIIDDVDDDEDDDIIRRNQSGGGKAKTEAPTRKNSVAMQKHPNAVTQFPWLIMNGRPTDSFSSERASKASTRISERQPTSTTSKRWIPKVSGGSARVGLGSKQALVLNRLEPSSSKSTHHAASKLDSLTTLKMSLNQNEQYSKQTSPSSSSTPLEATTTFSASSGPRGGIQSRWIPTTLGMSRLSTAAAGTSSAVAGVTGSPATLTPAQTQATSLSDTTKMSSTTAAAATTTTTTTTKSKEPPTQSDLMEARASDSISKFTTTHWNEAGHVNEMLATTRRLFQQPQPQIAQAGEYFSAETISSWPERYQTMLEGNSKSTIASSMMETTRRSGETYTPPGATTTTTAVAEQEVSQPATGGSNKLARHRYDVIAPDGEQTAAQTTRRMHSAASAFDSTGFTVLPANHKFSTTSQDEPLTASEASIAQDAQPQTVAAPEQSQHTTLTSANSNISGRQTNQTGPLKPPYSESLPQANSETAPAPPPDSYEEQPKSAAAAKSFLGAHNSLAHHHQGLNLSALKLLLSQGLFAPLVPDGRNRSLISPPVEQSIAAQNNLKHKVADSEALNNSDRLLEMLAGAQNSAQSMMQLPMSQYELLLNETETQLEHQLEQQSDEHSINAAIEAAAAAAAHSKGNSSSPKSLLGRASNLLNDLKQLEQRKAAALLAAIRHQVPGPLVRPWDLSSLDLQQASDRADDANGTRELSPVGAEAERDYLRAGLWLTRASEAVRSALAKQRLIPRNELEARLSGRKLARDDEISDSSERRSDSDSDRATLAEGDFVLTSGNRTRRKQDASYVFVAGNSSSPPSDGDDDDENDDSASEITRSILASKPSGGVKDRHGDNEFQLADLRDEATSKQQQQFAKHGQQYPKYIHMSDYRTSWSPRPVERRWSRGQLSSSAAIAARLRNNTASLMGETPVLAIDIAGAKQLDRESQEHSLQAFDCSEKPAGFHPDAGTKCQTFYHCSSTGHLLTFSCPQQTRFDEKSLKCGPWYEVSCDLGRSRIMQPSIVVR